MTHFRKAGIGVPSQVENENLERLSSLILESNCEGVIILGDLFHSHYNKVWEAFRQLLVHFEELPFTLVMGNHDILPEDCYSISNLAIKKAALIIAPFHFTHEPDQAKELYNMCGHIHPGIQLSGKAMQRLRLPCFSFGPKQAILPAFGGFTGLHCVDSSNYNHIYAIAEGSIVQVL